MKTIITEIKNIFIKVNKVIEFKTRIQERKEIFIILREK